MPKKLTHLLRSIDISTETDTRIQTLFPSDIQVSLDDVLGRMQKKTSSQELIDMTRQALETAEKLWQPGAVGRWLDIAWIRGDNVILTVPDDRSIRLTLGFSTRFLVRATRVFVAVYTIGRELETASKEASAKGDLLLSYLLDMVGLALLDKTGQVVTRLVEQEAAENGWGTGPFLSPGSVHGWEPEDQAMLCSVLPLESIHVVLNENNILSPFKSLSCLLPIGPGYTTTVIGSTCQVCSLRDNCSMKPDHFKN